MSEHWIDNEDAILQGTLCGHLKDYEMPLASRRAKLETMKMKRGNQHNRAQGEMTMLT